MAMSHYVIYCTTRFGLVSGYIGLGSTPERSEDQRKLSGGSGGHLGWVLDGGGHSDQDSPQASVAESRDRNRNSKRDAWRTS